MAKFVFTDGYLSIDSNDLSSDVSSLELNVEVEEKDTTTMGATHKENQGGLKSGTLAITFKQDVAAAALDSIMWALLGTVVAFEVRATSDAVGTSNPKYTGSVLINSWTPLSGSVGDVAEVQVSFPTSGTVTRATA